jgi:hypothetical protein
LNFITLRHEARQDIATRVRPRADVALDGRRVHRIPLDGDVPPLRIGIATLKKLQKTRLRR